MPVCGPFPQVFNPTGQPCGPELPPGQFTLAQLTTMILNAQTNYDLLMNGQQVVSFNDQNGERVQYQMANADKLWSYIQWLQGQAQALMYPDKAAANSPRPIGFIF